IIEVEGDAQAQYHFWDDKDNYQGVNLVVADKIVINVVADRTDEIKLSGRANGTFYPEGMQPRNSGIPQMKDGITLRSSGR
ncbi:hypothetical protein ACFLQV_01810, partial [Calditrichota bacterium]